MAAEALMEADNGQRDGALASINLAQLFWCGKGGEGKSPRSGSCPPGVNPGQATWDRPAQGRKRRVMAFAKSLSSTEGRGQSPPILIKMPTTNR